MPVNTPHQQYAARIKQWERCRLSREGSDAIKAAGKTFLPPIEAHERSPQKYHHYLMRALYYNAVARTIEGLAGAVFQKSPQIVVPSTAEEFVQDLTQTGVHAELFALHVLEEVLTTGRAGVLVDVPTDGGDRAYLVLYGAEDVISWRTERISGVEVVTQLVLREQTLEQDPGDDYAYKMVERYRVLKLDDGRYTQILFEQQGTSKEWVPVGPPIMPLRRGTPLDFIPFAFVNSTSNSADVQKPPLIDLVDVNLAHYRENADLKHGLHYAALPQPWITGALGDASGPLAIGSGVAWSLGPNGSAGMLEVAGPGFAAIREDLRDMEKMMATLGARLLEESPRVNETATSIILRHSGEHATLATIAQSLERGLTSSLRIALWWFGPEQKPKDVDAHIELNKDFLRTRVSADDLRSLVMALQAETISYETFYEQLVKGEMARPGVTADQERDAIQREQPALTETEDDDDGQEQTA